MKRIIVILLYFNILLSIHAFSIIEKNADFILEELYNGERYWGITSLPDNRLLVTEFKRGNLLLVEVNQNRITTTTIALPLQLERQAQAGIFDIALHPNFLKNHWIYFSYALKTKHGSALALARGKWINNQLEEIELLYQTPSEIRAQHYSGAITFDADHYLYLSSGERNNRHHSQNLTNPFGKILRLNDDGTIPEDNPLSRESNVAKEIYAWGVRNAQGLFYDMENHILWQSEQGPQGGDELNIMHAGKNYGWPEVTTGEEYGGGRIGVRSKAGMVDPLMAWTPSPAFSSLMVYQGDKIPSLHNKILIPSLVGEAIYVITVENNQVIHTQIIIKGAIGRIRNVKASSDGLIYIVNDNGKLYRLRPPSI